MIDIVISSCNRFNYLRITLATLKEALRGKAVKIYLWDNSSSSLPAIVKEFEDIEIVKQNSAWASKMGSHARYNHIITHAFIRSDKDYIFLLDSDACLHPKFYDKCLEMIKDLPGLGYGGVFNTPTHPPLSTVKNKYIKKGVIGAFATLIQRQAWDGLLVNYDMFKSDMEYGLAGYCNAHTKWGVCTTINSYVEHIGIDGTNKHGDGSVDRAINFYE